MTSYSDNEIPMEKQFSVSIEKELKKSYLDYAMSVIVGRALPDVRDGLKPRITSYNVCYTKLLRLFTQPSSTS